MTRAESLPWCLAGMALVPYATVPLSLEAGLRTQAGLLVAALVVVAWSGRWSLRDAFGGLPPAVRVGLCLYAGAALWGAVVGALADHPSRSVVSQLVSLWLLPAAALAFAKHPDLDGEALVRALGWAATAAAAFHAVGLAVPWLAGDLSGHFGFELRNSIGIVGLAPLLWLVGLALVCARACPASALVPVVAAGVLCFCAQSRGGWLISAAGSLGVLLLVQSRPLLVRVLVGALAVAPLVATAAAWASARAEPVPVVDGRTPTRLESPDAAGAFSEAFGEGAIEGAALEVSAVLRGARGRRLWVWADYSDDEGRALGRQSAEVIGTGDWRSWSELLAAPPGARSFRAGLRLDPGQGAWEAEGVSVTVVKSRLVGLGRQLRRRASSLGRVLADPGADSAIAYRLAEARLVLDGWRQAGPARRIAGFGLGATIELPHATFDDEGRRAVAPRSSYIHNFYLFLLYKLGLGGAAALAGLALITGWTVRSALSLRARPESSWLLAGVGVALLAYLVWSLTSPEIYDFRIAPLWGAMLAACGRAAERGRSVGPAGLGDGRPA